MKTKKQKKKAKHPISARMIQLIYFRSDTESTV